MAREELFLDGLGLFLNRGIWSILAGDEVFVDGVVEAAGRLVLEALLDFVAAAARL